LQRLINFFINVDKIFAKIIESLLVISLLSMVAFVILQVILRNVFSSGIAWADVATRHIVLWVTFLGAMLATRGRQHITIDILTRFIPRKPRNAVRIVLDSFAATIAMLLAITSLKFVIEEHALHTELMAGIPLWMVEVIIPFGFAMISIEYAIGIGLDIWRIATQDTREFEAGRGRG
jgi:TRAP-type C4-dicarboxylate transport system permease small subunit